MLRPIITWPSLLYKKLLNSVRPKRDSAHSRSDGEGWPTYHTLLWALLSFLCT